MSRFQVGDIITRDTWDSRYEVVRVCDAEETYDIRNLKYNETVIGWYYSGTYDLIICNWAEQNKSPIERKIAVMYKRFEKRKNHV